MLKYSKFVFDKSFSRIVYCCPSEISSNNKYVSSLKEIFPDLEVVYGLPSVDALQLRTDKSHKLIIIDDQFDACTMSKEIHDIFTIHSHHENISIILIGHNFFTRSKYGTTLSRNTTAKIIFYDKADQLFLSTLSRRLFPSHPKILNEAFCFLIENFPENYAKYLVVDTSPSSYLPQSFMIRTNIFPEKDGIVRPIFFPPN